MNVADDAIFGAELDLGVRQCRIARSRRLQHGDRFVLPRLHLVYRIELQSRLCVLGEVTHHSAQEGFGLIVAFERSVGGGKVEQGRRDPLLQFESSGQR